MPDYIDRAKIKYRKLWDYDETGTGVPVMAVTEEDVRKIQAAKVKRMEPASWTMDEEGGDRWYECSECGSYAPHFRGDGIDDWWLSNYCPECGARMKGVEPNAEVY